MITDEHRRNHLGRLVEAWDSIFDPEIIGLRHPRIKSPRPPATGGEESLHYALALLETAERSRQGRAEAIIHHLVASAGLPGALTLSLIWHRHRRRLPTALIGRITEHIGKAAHRILNSTTAKHGASTPEAINELFVLLSAARILDDAVLRGCATDRLDYLAAQAPRSAHASRVATPRDLAVALAGLRAMDQYINDPETSALVGAALIRVQNAITPALHATRTGPDLLDFLVGDALRGMRCGDPDSAERTFAALYACVMKIETPSPLFSDTDAVPAR